MTPPTLGVTIKGLSKKFPQNNVPFASAVQLSHFTEGKQIAEPWPSTFAQLLHYCLFVPHLKYLRGVKYNAEAKNITHNMMV